MNLQAKMIKLTDDLGNDILADVSISNLMDHITSKLINDIQVKRNLIITVD